MKLNTMKVCKILLLFIFLIPIGSFAQDSNSIQNRIKKVKSQISTYKSELTNLKEDTRDIVAKLTTLDKLIRKQQNLVANLKSEYSKLSIKIDSLRESLQTNTLLLKRSQKEYGYILMAMYKKRTSFGLWMFILSSRTFNEAYKRFIYLSQYGEYRRNHAANIIATSHKINDLIEDIEVKKKRQAEVLVVEIDELNELLASKESKRLVLSKFEKNTQKIKQSLNKLEDQNRQLSDQLSSLEIEIKNEAKKPVKVSSDNTKSIDYTSLFEKKKGKHNWPVDKGVIVVYFGKNTHPDLKNIFTVNDGVDIKITSGNKVKSIAAGVVKKIVSIPGLNNAIIIQHGEYFTLYSNVVDLKVKSGDLITENQILGNIFTHASDDNSGILKFQIWKNTDKLNPVLWLKRNP